MAIMNHSINELVKDFDKRGIRPHGKILTLSRYDTSFDKQYINDIFMKYGWSNRLEYEEIYPPNDVHLFNVLGFDSFEAMDYSDYEGASITFDLNNNDVPLWLSERYDYILDGGTLEHIFNIPNALQAIFKMLKVGGTFYFDSPAYWGINHGFYNISPGLYSEYFQANKWQINKITLYQESPLDIEWSEITVSEHGNGLYCQVWGSVTKLEDSSCNVIPQQSCFKHLWDKTYEHNRKIVNIFNLVTDGKLYLYGTGRHTRDLLMDFGDSIREKVKTGGIISAYPEEVGKIFMYGIEVYDISKVEAGDTIIISSKIHQSLIYNRISNLEIEGINLIKLY